MSLHAWYTKAHTDAEKSRRLHSWSSLPAAPGRREESRWAVEGTLGFPFPSRFLTVLMPTLATWEEWRLAAVNPAHRHERCLGAVPLVILELYLMCITSHQRREEGRQRLHPEQIIHIPAHFSSHSDDIFMWYSICPKTVTPCRQK